MKEHQNTDNQDDLITQVNAQVTKFLNDTQDARALSERDRDYLDNKQWTDVQINKLRARGQAPIVVNRIKPKHQGLLGLVALRKTDPKAYPRTRKHDNTAEAITDALRYVADNNDFYDTCKMGVADNFFCEGYGGALVDVKPNSAGEIEIRIEQIPWDRIYFDPYSRKRDFSDARYMGTIVWMSKDEVIENFPDVDLDQLAQGAQGYDETFEDRPRWVDSGKDRIRLAYHFWKKEGKWWMCVFSLNTFLVEPQESPFLDEFGEPSNPIELVGAYIDRNNNRYGEVRGFIDQQDEINHRRSKALHLLTQRQTAGRRGSIKDIDALKRELSKPNGHVEYDGEKGDFEILPTGDMAKGQFELYQDAKAELDAVSFNSQLAGDRQKGDLSGVAIDRLQQAGTIELNNLFTALNGWEKRIYRQVWARVKQFWTEEKWIRVTDDQDNLRWVGLNGQVTAQEWLEEIINDKSESLVKRKQASATYQFLMQAMQSNNLQEAAAAEAKLKEIVTVRNKPAELDVDIILDQSFDTVNVQQEQFEVLAKFAQGQDIDILELIELSQLRGKDELIDKIKKRREAQSQQPNPEAAQKQAEMQQKAQEAQNNLQIKVAELQSTVELNKQKLDSQIELEKVKASAKIELEKEKLGNTMIMKAQELQQKAFQANTE